MDELIELTVKNGEIERPGIARISSSVFDELGLDEENQSISISYNEKSIMRKAFSDDLVDKHTIILRQDARKDLDVSNGENVKVKRYSTAGEEIKEDYAETKEKVKESVKKQKENIKERMQKDEETQEET